MGIISLAKKALERRSRVDDPQHWINKLTESLSTRSGAVVTYDTALATSAVFACVRVISETIASMPLLLYKRRADGGKDVARDHYLYPLLHDSPNQWQTHFEHLEMAGGHLALRGNSYNYLIRNAGGRISSIVPLNPVRMEVEVDGTVDSPQIIYRYRPQGVEPEVLFTPDEIWHIKGLSNDGFVGLSPLTLAAESIGLSQAAESHGAYFFRNGAQTTGVASMPGKLTEDAGRRLRASLQEAMTAANKFKVLLLEQGLEYKAVGMSNADSQFLETRQFQIEEIARIFRVPCVLIGHPDKTATYASAEQFFLSFVVHSVRPWATRIEQSINKSLLSEADRRAGYFAEFKIDGLLRGDIASRYNAYASALQNTWMSRNEVRALENLNPVPDGDKFENPAITTKTPTEEKGTQASEGESK